MQLKKTKIDKVIVNTPARLVSNVKTSNKHSNQAEDKIEKIIKSTNSNHLNPTTDENQSNFIDRTLQNLPHFQSQKSLITKSPTNQNEIDCEINVRITKKKTERLK